MSFQPVIPGGWLSSRARFRFTGRSHSATAAQCWYTLFQPTEGVPFLVCLIHGGKRRPGARGRYGQPLPSVTAQSQVGLAENTAVTEPRATASGLSDESRLPWKPERPDQLA